MAVCILKHAGLTRNFSDTLFMALKLMSVSVRRCSFIISYQKIQLCIDAFVFSQGFCVRHVFALGKNDASDGVKNCGFGGETSSIVFSQ
jgi:hypothetical protein